MTNDLCKSLIESHGISTNPLKNIIGLCYTTNREQDLKFVINEILKERSIK